MASVGDKWVLIAQRLRAKRHRHLVRSHAARATAQLILLINGKLNNKK